MRPAHDYFYMLYMLLMGSWLVMGGSTLSGHKKNTFSFATTSLVILYTELLQDNMQIQVKGCSHFALI